MNDQIRQQIYNNMSLKATDELLEIWQTNDHVEWSSAAFAVIQEILTRRGVEIPEQDEPILEHGQLADDGDETYGFSELELKIIDDENPPEFYDPLDALHTSVQITRIAKILVGLEIAYLLTQIPSAYRTAQSYVPNGPLVIGLGGTILGLAFSIATSILLTYFPLMALARILRILMEMEFTSRKAT